MALAIALGEARAAEPAEPAAEAPIVVLGERRTYAPVNSGSALKFDAPLKDTPQSISVVSEALIEDANLRSIGEVLRFTPGATHAQGEGHRDQVVLRGNNTTADFFVDGLRDDVQYYRPLYNLERVEVLRGANALAFGRGGGGGVINRVTKAPVLEGRFASLFGGADSFGGFFAEADVNQPLGQGAGLRLNAFYEDGRNHRDVFFLERFGANPTLRLEPGKNTALILSYEYLNDFRIVDRGVPSLGGTPIRGFRDTFFGDADINEADLEAHILRARAEHSFSDRLELAAQFVFGDFDKVYRNAFPATAVSFDPVTGAGSLGVEAYVDPTTRRNAIGQLVATWRPTTGPISHTFIAGLEAGDQQTENQRINGFFDSGVATTSSGRRTVVGLNDPLVIPPITFRAGPGNRSVATDAQIFSVFVQDQLAWGRFQLILGGRYDRFDLTVDDLLANAEFQRTDDVFSPRAALVFQATPDVSVYASYARSFLPQSGDQFLSLDLSLEALEPERFDSTEVGVKWNILEHLAFTAALYRLERDNTRAPSGTAGVIVLSGEQRSRGLELSLAGEITRRWRVAAAYALQEAEITSGTTAAPTGREIALTPRQTFSLWSRYDATRRFGFAGGVTFASDSFAAISNATVLPSYARLDAALFWRLTDRLEAQVNLENLTNVTYFPTAHTDNNITTGAPINAALRLRALF
jgi:catecholate siderophore receptor